jgi:hypothetical protein
MSCLVGQQCIISSSSISQRALLAVLLRNRIVRLRDNIEANNLILRRGVGKQFTITQTKLDCFQRC